MDIKLLVTVIVLGVALLGALVLLLIALFNGSMKNFVIEAWNEAEKKFPKTEADYQTKRMDYVVNAVKEKYKLMAFALGVKKFVELLCKLCKAK